MKDSLRKALEDVLIGHGVTSTENQGLHSWRCKYSEYSKTPCTCVKVLLDDLVKAVHQAEGAS